VLGNVVYGLWIVSFANQPDPFTAMVTSHAAKLLQLLGLPAGTYVSGMAPNVALQMNGQTVVRGFEGCNAINVSVLFVAFLFAYKGSLKSTMIFALLGLLAIYIFNLLRVAGLFLVARFYPEQLYLMHKFVFTGIIYAFVFALWYIWITRFANLLNAWLWLPSPFLHWWLSTFFNVTIMPQSFFLTLPPIFNLSLTAHCAIFSTTWPLSFCCGPCFKAKVSLK